MSDDQKTAVIAVIGRPNAGKSTLINNMVGQKISIISHKPQTTRHRVHAIHTSGNHQFVFIDTPGINITGRSAFLRELNKTARSVLSDVDVILLMLDGLNWDEREDAILSYLPKQAVPCLLVINKIDRYKTRDSIIRFIDKIRARYEFSEVIPLSVKRKKDMAYIEKVLANYTRPGEFIFPHDQVTDQSMKFYASELIREKILRRFNKEIPYSAAVTVDRYEEKQGMIRIAATIHVEQDSHKQIIVGEKGQGIREIGRQARLALEKETGSRVFLKLWVKLSKAWSNNPKLIREFGYESS
jgi:GTP-binding protein Era